jgi:hypothetical protein
MNVICCRCGSTKVSCGAMINPNTKEFIHYTDESFRYGWCEDCKTGQPLTDTEEVKSEIDNAYKEYKRIHKEEPSYAFCAIIFTDDDNSLQDVPFKLSEDAESDDDDVFFYCSGVEDLKSLAEFPGNDFIITGLDSFSK